MQTIDLVVLLLYLGGIVGIGVWTSRHSRSSERFMSAGRGIAGWAVGLSIFGTYVSSISFLALPGKAFASNWNAFVFSLAIPAAAWVAAAWIVPFYRASSALSSYEHLEHRFGPWARIYAMTCYLLTQFARSGTIMYLLALALAPLTGWSVPALILVTGVAVIAYALIGGIEAVIWTDVVQSVILIGGALTCAAVLLLRMPDGPGQLVTIAAGAGKFSLGSAGPSLRESTIWVVLLYGLFINLQNFGIDQTYVQRYQTARSLADARRSVWLGALLYLPVSAVFFFIGSGLYAYYRARPDRLPAAVLASPDAVFPYFIVHELPAGLVGLVIAAIFAAAQSTISSSVNSSATLVLCDVYQRFVRPSPSERERLVVLRTATVGIGAAGVAMAFAMTRIRSALDAWWQLAGIFGGGMLGLFLAGRLSNRITSHAAASGVIAGVAVILWMTFSPAWPDALAAWRSPFHGNLIIVIGTLLVLAAARLAATAGRPARP